MKRYLLFPLLLVIFVSCKKDKNDTPSIVGTWELRLEYTTTTEIFHQPGNDTIIKFTGNTYERFIDGARVRNGTYQLTTVTTRNGAQTGYRIIFDNVISDTTFYGLQGHTLNLFHDFNPAVEGISGVLYEKISP